jgi:hypothetical protein
MNLNPEKFNIKIMAPESSPGDPMVGSYPD